MNNPIDRIGNILLKMKSDNNPNWPIVDRKMRLFAHAVISGEYENTEEDYQRFISDLR